jgi:molybdopterin molybdotransferase
MVPSRAATGRAPAIGLPGNPVSSFLTFLMLVRPFLLTLQGATRVAPEAVQMRADFDWPRADKRREFLRARRNAAGGLELFGNQSSGVLTSMVWGDGVVDNPAGPDHQVGRHRELHSLRLAAGLSVAMKVQVRYFASVREALSQQQ